MAEKNIEGVLHYCVQAGVYGIITFGMGMTLREGDREYFYQKLDEHFPGMKSRYHHKYGYAYEIPSDHEKELMTILHRTCAEYGIECDTEQVFRYLQEFPENKGYEQLSLF